MRRGDWFLACGTILIALALFFVFFLQPQDFSGNMVDVRADGKLVGQYPLAEDGCYMIRTAQGYNLLKIENRQAWIDESDCPDKTCTRFEALGAGNAQNIICLPHRLIISLSNESGGEIDALVR